MSSAALDHRRSSYLGPPKPNNATHLTTAPPSPHRVHFDQNCTIIPTANLTTPRFWNSIGRLRRASSSSSDQTPPSPLGKSHSLKRPSSSSSSERQVAPPCLRHDGRARSSSLNTPRSTSAYPPVVHRITASPDHDHSLPLRDCCAACMDKVELPFQPDYHEHWSKGASRKRRLSDSILGTSTSPTTAFSPTTLLKVDEAGAPCDTFRRPPPIRLVCSAEALETPFDEEDEAMLFPLPSPRRSPQRTPSVGHTPTSTPPPSKIISKVPSPAALVEALDRTATPKPRKTDSPKTGRALLQMLPDVDALPPNLQRRSASDGAVRQTSPERRRKHMLLHVAESAFAGFGRNVGY